MPNKVASRVMEICNGETPIVVIRRGEGFQIGYEGTVWGYHAERSSNYVGTFGPGTELEQLSAALQRAL